MSKENTEIELTKEKSEEQAEIIIQLAILLQGIDLPYMEKFGAELARQASWQDSAFILNPSASVEKNDLLHKQSEAVGLLCKYIKCLKEVDQLKHKIQIEQQTRERIARMFI